MFKHNYCETKVTYTFGFILFRSFKNRRKQNKIGYFEWTRSIGAEIMKTKLNNSND